MLKWLNWPHNSRPLRKRSLTFQKLLQVWMAKWLSFLPNSRPRRMIRLSFNKKILGLLMKLRSWTPDSRKPRSQRNKLLRLNSRTWTRRTWICKNRWDHSPNSSKNLLNYLPSTPTPSSHQTFANASSSATLTTLPSASRKETVTVTQENKALKTSPKPNRKWKSSAKKSNSTASATRISLRRQTYK